MSLPPRSATTAMTMWRPRKDPMQASPLTMESPKTAMVNQEATVGTLTCTTSVPSLPSLLLWVAPLANTERMLFVDAMGPT
eukprot:8325739-Lingulodinium_polyedra.AAC.1